MRMGMGMAIWRRFDEGCVCLREQFEERETELS